MAGDGDRKALDANGRELVDALTSLLAGDVRGKVLLLLCFTRGLCVESVRSGTAGPRSILLSLDVEPLFLKMPVRRSFIPPLSSDILMSDPDPP